MKALLYCTKGKPNLWQERDESNSKLNNFLISDIFGKKENFLNGKIVAEVEIDKVEEIILNGDEIKCKYGTRSLFSIEEESCLTFDALDYYLNVDKPYGYALHLTNLKVFDRPLSFDKDYIYKDYKTNALITKAPQNMCYCYDRFGNKYVLISIQPQHLCKILNGEKTIEVRRKVLNCLKEMC